MKSKPVVISVAVIIVLAVAFLFVRAKFWAKPEKKEITQFLVDFKNQLQYHNPDSVLAFFEMKERPKPLIRFASILCGNSGFNGKSKPLFSFDVNVDASDVTVLSPDVIQVIVPVEFHGKVLPDQKSVLQLKIHRVGSHRYKIMQVDAQAFLADYLAYENKIKSKTVNPADIYSPATLAAFATAEKLKSRYDSVLWFAHDHNNRTYYYVAKGKWDMGKTEVDSAQTGMMGLVGPDLKELIPPKYDLIHNIGGTFEGLIEVDSNHKHGFYDLNGNMILPAEYDQVFPVDDEIHLAALRKGDDYYWLDSGYKVTDKADIKIKDVLDMLPKNGSFTYSSYFPGFITEFNSRDDHAALFISPSYLVDLKLMDPVLKYRNELRHNVEYDDISNNYEVNFKGTVPQKEMNWLEAAFYSIRNYYVGGRSEFYDSKTMIITDNKRNQAYSAVIQSDYSAGDGDGALSGKCNENELRMINDTLYEVKSTAITEAYLDDKHDLSEAPIYHYLYIKNNKLVEKQNNRLFSFTKFVKMDDSYLNGCYVYNNKTKNRFPDDMLRYMKNEIFADYNYKFKDSTWINAFADRFPNFKADNVSVEDSLTEIDRYNINWINERLKVTPANKTLAAK